MGKSPSNSLMASMIGQISKRRVPTQFLPYERTRHRGLIVKDVKPVYYTIAEVSELFLAYVFSIFR